MKVHERTVTTQRPRSTIGSFWNIADKDKTESDDLKPEFFEVGFRDGVKAERELFNITGISFLEINDRKKGTMVIGSLVAKLPLVYGRTEGSSIDPTTESEGLGGRGGDEVREMSIRNQLPNSPFTMEVRVKNKVIKLGSIKPVSYSIAVNQQDCQMDEIIEFEGSDLDISAMDVSVMAAE